MKKTINILLCGLTLVGVASCSDSESYADLLRDESYAVNAFLADYPIITSHPADGDDFISTDSIKRMASFRAAYSKWFANEDQYADSIDAAAQAVTPFYRMDDEGYVYMQVIDPGNGAYAEEDQQIQFRFTRYNLAYLYKYGTYDYTSNEEDVASNPTSFRFMNTTLTSTTQWGEGIQVPLYYLRLNCRVRMVIKSYLGPTEEVTSVYPYLYSLRYYASKI